MVKFEDLADKIVTSDVLIIGSEGAGARAAIEAAEQGAEVTIVSKGKIAKCGTTIMAGADITLDGKSLNKLGFAGDPEDSEDKFFRDIVVQGFYINNQRLVRAYVSSAPARVKELLDWGLRVSSAGRREINTTGVEIMRVLAGQVRKFGNIQIVEDVMVTDLLTKNDKVLGAVGVNINTGEFMAFKSKAVVLATGGWHEAYLFNTGSAGLSGDGQAMAYRAGAELINMEMVTFCPNVILWPPIYRGSIFLYILGMFHGSLLNSKGERFLEKYHPSIVELATKTEWNKLLLSVFSMREIREGKASPHGGVYFSLKGLSKQDLENSEAFLIMPNWKFQGTDFTKLVESMVNGELMEVGPAAHYFEGGIKINERCGTSLRGLYAAGECCGGLFGANRVAAATTEIIVQGAIAGKCAAEYAKKLSNNIKVDVDQVKKLKDKVFGPLKRKEGVEPLKIKRKIQVIAQENIGVIRDRNGLKNAIEQLSRIKESELSKMCPSIKVPEYNMEWVEILEIENMTQVLEISARSALLRKESRGVHYRLDYPNVNNNYWLVEIVTKRANSNIKAYMCPITITDIKPPRRLMSFEESILKAIEICK
jgi:succinate dehydrogenase/fumarate reductase flavoprotein subunit